MAYITSRNYRLPASRSEMERGTWYNMWKRKLWPYQELLEDDLVYWYQSSPDSEAIVWVSRIKRIERFPYGQREEAGRRIEKTLGKVDRNERYFKTRATRGYCLAYKVSAVKKLKLRKPYGHEFRRSGWERVDEKVAQEWLRAW